MITNLITFVRVVTIVDLGMKLLCYALFHPNPQVREMSSSRGGPHSTVSVPVRCTKKMPIADSSHSPSVCEPIIPGPPVAGMNQLHT